MVKISNLCNFIVPISVRLLSILMAVVIWSESFSQTQLHTKSKKAVSYYQEADNYRVRGHYDVAIQLLERALQKDDQFAEAYARLGLVYRMAGNLTLCQQHYEKALELFNPVPPPRILFDLGELYLQLGKYELSEKYLKKYLNKTSPNSKSYAHTVKMLKNVNFAIKTIGEAEPIEIVPLSDTINQFALQYFPVLTADQKQLIYTIRLGSGPDDDEDLKISIKNDSDEWGPPLSLSATINSSLNEGTCTISADGRTLIFTSCQGREGYGSCDLFLSKKIGVKWSVPKNMGATINSSAWDSQPSLSADGRILYFVSTRKGGIGKQDIWVSYLSVDEKWSKPKNLGNKINTKENDISPFMHPNGQTLYYSSKGHVGMGGFDIYYSERIEGEFVQPTNFGYPVNNGEDQVSIFITADGKRAYYSNACGSGAQTCSKLFSFDIPESKRVNFKSNYISGRVLDSLTQQPVKAKIDLYDIENRQLILSVNSDAVTGEYLMVLTEGANYALYVYADGYLFKNERFEYEQKIDMQPIYKDINLLTAKKGAKLELKNIFFEHDSFELNDRSLLELRIITKFLLNNPEVRIRIEGHTDDTGNYEYNLLLSKRRAQSVYSYLIENNIPQFGLEYIGFGAKFPRYNGSNALEKKKNRRIEFKIL